MYTIKIGRQVPLTARCRHVHVRREKLVRILDDQIKTAERLSQDQRYYNTEAKHAWDIVEELSQKLDKLTSQLEDCVCEEQQYFARDELDTRLSSREYDI